MPPDGEPDGPAVGAVGGPDAHDPVPHDPVPHDPVPHDPVTFRDGEIERLRALVGPTESSYEDLRVELAHAQAAVKAAEAELGRLRSEITELRIDLHRARQDQYHIRRLVLRPALAIRNRLRRSR